MKYSPKYFHDSLPAWKRKKDPVLSRVIYRPLSFLTASLCAHLKISANAVSYFSLLVGIAGCALFIPDNYACNICGAALVNLWLLLDCTDGNLARSVKRQPFGEFADSSSSYVLVGLLGTAMGVCVFIRGGMFFGAGTLWLLILGVLASEGDTLMRLVYQKYKNVERSMEDEGLIARENDVRTDHGKVGSLRVRIEAELGIGGLIPLLVLLTTIFHCLDIAVLYCAVYYCGSCIAMVSMYILKAIKKTKSIEKSVSEKNLTENSSEDTQIIDFSGENHKKNDNFVN